MVTSAAPTTVPTYRKGDMVLIRSVMTPKMAEYFNVQREEFMGKIVTLNTDVSPGDIFYVASGLAFRTDCIERKITQDELADFVEKERQRRRELEEKHKDKYFSASRVGELAIDVFGDDRVDVVEEGGGNNFSIIILFPEFELTNSRNAKHIIRDLYVKFDVVPNILALDGKSGYKAAITFMGRRGKFTLKEQECAYIHSHLKPAHYHYHSFCLGSSSFGMMIEETKMELGEDDWMKLFLSLPNFVKWESLEGGPYTKIEGMGYKNNVNSQQLDQELIRIMGNIPKEVWEINEDLCVIQGHPRLGEYFNEFSKIRRLQGYSPEQYKVAMGNKQKVLSELYKQHPLVWKGMTIEPKIIEDPSLFLEGNTMVEKAVIDQYSTLLTEKSKTFLKTKTYKDARSKNYQKVFGQAGTVQQANASTDKSAKAEN